MYTYGDANGVGIGRQSCLRTVMRRWRLSQALVPWPPALPCRARHPTAMTSWCSRRLRQEVASSSRPSHSPCSPARRRRSSGMSTESQSGICQHKEKLEFPLFHHIGFLTTGLKTLQLKNWLLLNYRSVGIHTRWIYTRYLKAIGQCRGWVYKRCLHDINIWLITREPTDDIPVEVQ